MHLFDGATSSPGFCLSPPSRRPQDEDHHLSHGRDRRQFPLVLSRIETDAGVTGWRGLLGAGVAELVHKARPLVIAKTCQHQQDRRGDDPLPVRRGLPGRHHRHRISGHRDRAWDLLCRALRRRFSTFFGRPLPATRSASMRLPRRRHARSRRLRQARAEVVADGFSALKFDLDTSKPLHHRHLRRSQPAPAWSAFNRTIGSREMAGMV